MLRLTKLFCNKKLMLQNYHQFIPPNTTVAYNEITATHILERMKTMKDRIFACDTEVSDIDIDRSPIGGNGTVICASIYCGPGNNFGSGSRLWIDNYGPSKGTLDYFKEFFESDEYKKVWHHYSFDTHVLSNHGIITSGFVGDTIHMARLNDTSLKQIGGYSLESLSDTHYIRKVPMTEKFSHFKTKKDGTPSKLKILPDVVTLQTDENYRKDWIEYSVFDAEATWHVYERLTAKLKELPWCVRDSVQLSMIDFYNKYYVPFGQLLVDIERNGIKVDVDHLKSIEQRAHDDQNRWEMEFRDWLAGYDPMVSKEMNINSAAQKQQLLFAPYQNIKDSTIFMPEEKGFEVPNTGNVILPGKKKALKNQTIMIKGFGLPAKEITAAGWPSVTASGLNALVGNPDQGKFGPAYDYFGKGDRGEKACKAISSLASISSIDTMLNTFIIPLQSNLDPKQRVHGSLNINTETGRLSSRSPNLQNQPSLDKDTYKIRKAFIPDTGDTFIVADYSQLELRVLAHMTNCTNMIEAFKLGGDFHSRTAYSMYSYIKEAVKNGEVRLEKNEGDPSTPLVKDKYHSERKKAKILNFSIAYGKTPRGLSKDFGVSVEEATDTLNKWYLERPEVQKWQQNTINIAKSTGYTRTLMGRYRKLPDIMSKNYSLRGHGQRSAINTPIQGGAADIVMMAMLKLHTNKRLQELGYKLLLQIHDEVIVEGPTQYKDAALELIRNDMEHPFEAPLLVDLVVDIKCAQNWYDGK